MRTPHNNKYPTSRIQVTKSGEAITILFPQRVSVKFQRFNGKGITGIQDLFVGQREVLSAPPDMDIPPSSLDVLGDGEVGGVKDWAAYLKEREDNDGRWPKRGGREIYPVAIDSSEYIGFSIEEGSATVHTRLRDGKEIGKLDWVISPVSMNLGGRDYLGVGWKVRIEGLERAMWLRIVESAVVRFGDWAFAQIWGNFIEGHIGFSTPFTVPQSWYFGDAQPFFFNGGQNGAIVSFFDKPVGARVAVNEEAERLFNILKLPLGVGAIRETPMKYWLRSNDTFPTKWAALDEWTSVYDAIANHYRRSLGIGVTDPKPTLLVNWPGEDYYDRYKESGRVKFEESWLCDFSRKQLHSAAGLGLRVIIIDGHWDVDALYPPEHYLPGSQCFGSAEAPWRLEISEAVGGERALRELCNKAHELGMKIVLWTTSADLSNSSPLLREHPEWIKWQCDGIPETFGYEDITGTSLNSSYYDYAMTQFRKIKRTAAFDGFLIDSFLSFGLLPDYRERQPSPQLDRLLAMQREFWDMGLTEIHIEGCGPLGLSASGYGYEMYEFGRPDERKEAIELSERIRGREYGLYRYVADSIIEPESYYRALASKGIIGVFNLDVISKFSESERARIAQANEDYMRVLEKMERRHLIADGDRWQGVAWRHNGSTEVLLFAFDSFRYPLAGCAVIEDITLGICLEAKDSFETSPMHTYIISSGAKKLIDTREGVCSEDNDCSTKARSTP